MTKLQIIISTISQRVEFFLKKKILRKRLFSSLFLVNLQTSDVDHINVDNGEILLLLKINSSTTLYEKWLDAEFSLFGNSHIQSKKYPPSKYMSMEYLRMIYSRDIQEKFPMKFQGIFSNKVPGILNIDILSDCSINILRMLHVFF